MTPVVSDVDQSSTPTHDVAIFAVENQVNCDLIVILGPVDRDPLCSHGSRDFRGQRG